MDNNVTPNVNELTIQKKKSPYILKRLNRRQKDFCLEYAIGGIACKAYYKAYKIPEEQWESSEACAYKLLKQQLIKDEVDRLCQELSCSADEINGIYSTIARSGEAAKDRLHALDSMAKIKGMMTDTSSNVQINLSSNVLNDMRQAIVNSRVKQADDVDS